MRFSVAALLAGLVIVCYSQGCKTPGKSSLATHQDSVSYGIGYNIGRNLDRDSIKVSYDALALGMKDALADSTKKILSEKIVDSVMKVFQQEMMEKQTAMLKAKASDNKGIGEKFLADNKNQTGVVTLEDGLQYKVIKEGNGPIPKANQTVTVHYTGKLLDGSVFDSSYKRGEPATFPVSGVIPGWTEALTKMKVGSKWLLWIPSDLAYGERGAGSVIPPNATLAFEVELLSVK